jgi:hypothetical protein
VVKALGSLGDPERFFGPPLEDGNHLRWAFSHELGFPAYGFTIYRRTHVPGRLIELSNQHYKNDVIRFPEVVRRVMVELVTPQLHLRGRSRLPSITGLFENVLVLLDLTKRLGPRHVSLELQGDAFDTIQVNNRARWKVSRVRYVPVSQDINQRWQKIKAICLPFTDPSYPCQNSNANPAADWQEAASRIPPQVRSHYMGEQANPSDNWQQLHESMKDLYNPPIPSTKGTSGYFELKQPSAFMQPLDIMLLATIDPYLSRMLGLYWTDSAHSGTSYDYKVVGNWAKDQIKNHEMEVNFDDTHVGQQIAETFLREDLIFRCPSKGTIVKLIGTPWNDTRKALDLKIPTIFPRLVISFTEPVGEIQIYLRLFGGQPVVDASLISLNNTATGSVIIKRWKSHEGMFIVLTIAVRNKTDRIESITLGPAPNSPTIHIALCKIGILQSWSPPTDEEIAWNSYNVKSRIQPTLSPPTDLEVKPIETPSRELAQNITVAGCMAGLNWKQPDASEAHLSDQPVRYIVQRQGLGDGPASSPMMPAQWKVIKNGDDTPVTAAIQEDSIQYKFVDDPAVAELAENQSAQRHYAYRITGVDLFGRVGLYSEAMIVDLKDSQAPPPPLNVEAEYLEDGNPRVRVRWKWPVSLRKQAPDARQFRVYLQTGRLNTIAGHINAIEDTHDGKFTVTTNRELEHTASENLVGEWLQNNDAYFKIVHHNTGVNFQLIIRQIGMGNTSKPTTGPFSISLRPRKLMTGEVTKVRRHLDGTVTVRTDLTVDSGSISQDNKKWLDQGGRQFPIESIISGSNVALTVRSRKFPMAGPSIGRFTIVQQDIIQQDKRSPVTLDPGNPLFKDYLHANKWEKRVAVKQISESSSYEVVFPFDDFAIPENEPVTYLHLGVSTSDDKDYVPDDDRWNGTEFGSLRGNEGKVCSPVTIQKVVVMQEPIERLSAPDVGEGITTVADYYGQSFITLNWMSQPNFRYDIYRALDESIIGADKKSRPSRSIIRSLHSWLSDEDFQKLVIEQPNYNNLSDSSLQGLASLLGNEEAFSLVTTAPLDSNKHTVVIDGRKTNRQCFALKAIDVSGKPTTLGLPSLPIKTPYILLPRRPIITNISAEDRRVTIKWTVDKDPDLRKYLICRADSEEKAQDLRLMDLVGTHEVTLDVEGRPNEQDFSTAQSDNLITYYYTIVAVDKNHIFSRSSNIAAAQSYDDTRPNPPEWGPAIDTDVGLQLNWTLADPSQKTLVQRHDPTSYLDWTNLTTWLPIGTQSTVDTQRVIGRVYTYRIFVKDQSDRTNREFREFMI